MSVGTCDNCGRKGHRHAIRGDLICEPCSKAWIAGYAAAHEDRAAGDFMGVDAGASTVEIAEEASGHWPHGRTAAS